MERQEDEIGRTLLGQVHSILGTRRSTVDQGDGGIVITIEIPAASVPREYVVSAVDTVWAVALQDRAGGRIEFEAGRMTTRDGRKGSALIRLLALASDLPPESIFGCNETPVLVEMALTSGASDHRNGLDRAERLRILRSCFAHCREPEFLAFLENEARRRGFPVQEVGDDEPGKAPEGDDAAMRPTTEDRTAQHVYLLARIHSRQEILDGVAAANAVDEILRAYRSHLWNRRATAPRSERTEEKR